MINHLNGYGLLSVLSFGFCILIVLLADSYILISMLMILKTLAYVLTILIEFVSMIKKQWYFPLIFKNYMI